MSAFGKGLKAGISGAAVALLGACAHYTPLPLPTAAPLASALASTLASPLAERASPTGTIVTLSMEQVVALALADNPDLKALRLRRGVAAGQAKQARLLPNPSLSAAFLPLLSGAGSVPGWNLGLSQDIKAIITYTSRQRATRDAEGQVAADIVWQEWQVAGKARQLVVDIVMGERLHASAQQYHRLLADRNARMERALAAGAVTLATIAPDRMALQSARGALDSLDQNQMALHYQLAALLGLRPDADIPLSSQIAVPAFDAALVRAQIADLPARRPDLLALRLGYAAADEAVRQAILSQFPDLVFGVGAASDNSKVISGGPDATLGLPIFDRGQGGIAIAHATRAQLHAEYAARLAATTGEVLAMTAQGEQLASQLAIARRDLAPARAAAERAHAGFVARHLDERTYLDLVANRFAREQDIMTMETALLDRQIAIQTLIGTGLPIAELPAEPEGGRP